MVLYAWLSAKRVNSDNSDDTNKNMSSFLDKFTKSLKNGVISLQHCHVVYAITGTYGILSIFVSPYRDQYMHTR